MLQTATAPPAAPATAHAAHGGARAAAGAAKKTRLEAEDERAASVQELHKQYMQLESTSRFVVKHTLDGILTAASSNVVYFLGYESSQMVNMSTYELVHPDDLQAVLKTHLELMQQRSNAPLMAKYRMRTKKNTHVLVHAVFYLEETDTSYNQLWAGVESPSYVICCICTDVSDVPSRIPTEQQPSRLNVPTAAFPLSDRVVQMQAEAARLRQSITEQAQEAERLRHEIRQIHSFKAWEQTRSQTRAASASAQAPTSSSALTTPFSKLGGSSSGGSSAGAHGTAGSNLGGGGGKFAQDFLYRPAMTTPMSATMFPATVQTPPGLGDDVFAPSLYFYPPAGTTQQQHLQQQQQQQQQLAQQQQLGIKSEPGALDYGADGGSSRVAGPGGFTRRYSDQADSPTALLFAMSPPPSSGTLQAGSAVGPNGMSGIARLLVGANYMTPTSGLWSPTDGLAQQGLYGVPMMLAQPEQQQLQPGLKRSNSSAGMSTPPPSGGSSGSSSNGGAAEVDPTAHPRFPHQFPRERLPNGKVIGPRGGRRERKLRPPPFGDKCGECELRLSSEWRKGPDPNKLLCNACGLRFNRKCRKSKKDASQGGRAGGGGLSKRGSGARSTQAQRQPGQSSQLDDHGGDDDDLDEADEYDDEFDDDGADDAHDDLAARG